MREAVALEQDGVDAVVAQGYEAGGHRGTFLDDFDQSLIGTLALVLQVADAVSVPVIASGGIMDGRGIAAALALGAQAAQMGTAFLSTEESGICDAYKAVLPASRSEQSRITRPFRAAGARHRHAFMRDMDANPSDILPYPLQNALTRPCARRRPRRRYRRAVAVGGPGRAHGAARERRRTGAPAGRRPPRPRPGANQGPISGRAAAAGRRAPAPRIVPDCEKTVPLVA